MSKIISLKYARFKRILGANNGILSSLKTIFRTDDLKSGKLVGEDKFGNKYYENDHFFVGRNRWVVYGKIGWDYEGSCVPPEWHRWLHYIGDQAPSNATESNRKNWYLDYTMNNTLDLGKKYNPYTTTKPKIQAWDPSNVQK